MSPYNPELAEKARAVKDSHKDWLLSRANVVGVGLGFRQRHGQSTGDLAIVVMVSHKLPPGMLDPQDVLPLELDGIPLDVQEIGTPAAL